MIKRIIFQDLIKHLSSKEISLIIGPRQVGKTTLMKAVKEHLDKQKKKTVFLNLDYEPDKQFFESQEKLLNKIKLEIGLDKKGYVFIDEIQRKENAGLFLKGIYDLGLPYKFIVSGSGSLELKEKIHESLTGRKRLFEMRPVNLYELVDFKTNYNYENKLVEFLKLHPEKSKNYLNEYLNFGGYPRVVSETQLEEKNKIIDEIFKSYLEKDIAYLLKVEKTENFSQMIKLLANQIGQLINYSKLSNDLNLSLPTLKNYLWYAEKTFIIRKITPYFKNARKEITKAPLIYFNDLGLRNYGLNQFGLLSLSDQLSFPFQNFIANILTEKLASLSSTLHFWRTKDKAEVDLVIKKGNDVLPIEVKYAEFKKPVIEKSMRSFIEKYEPGKAWIINLNLSAAVKINRTDVKWLPFYNLAEMESKFI